MRDKFLPTTPEEARQRGWDSLDIIIVTGDAYVDHPSYGAAVIGRVLENAGFRVGIIAQPDCRSTEDFTVLGRPKLFFGVTAGNLDSMVANYTANKLPRSDDEYSPGGAPGLRPDRAVIAYTNRIRQAFESVPVVIGGMEASMRRLAHYDYWSDKVRRSILLDSKADILVYGMGETQIVTIAGRMKAGCGIKDISDVRGTVIVRNSIESFTNMLQIPSFEETASDKIKFTSAAKSAYYEADPVRGKTLAQKHGERFVIQFPPAAPLDSDELDRIYDLPYLRAPHPSYAEKGGVPGFETVRFSVISHRGCPGGCNFCSLYMHQGRILQSRSEKSILGEIKKISSQNDFAGTITDIGGPTANMYAGSCRSWKGAGACRNKRCLVPSKCPSLKLGYSETLGLWGRALAIPKVKHVFVGSGIRYDLACDMASDAYLKALSASHVSGQLKVAPEHTEASVLALMSKPGFDVYEDFARRFEDANRKLVKKQYLVNYFIIGHPGSGLSETLKMALKLEELGIRPQQVQDFIPLPMTISGVMYHTEADPFTGNPVYVPKGARERRLQRALIQHNQPANKKYVVEALRRLNKMRLIGKLLKNRVGSGRAKTTVLRKKR
jgi:uncharacterized radical SAM protein YgiQ